jgi:hypothetical protein
MLGVRFPLESLGQVRIDPDGDDRGRPVPGLLVSDGCTLIVRRLMGESQY